MAEEQKPESESREDLKKVIREVLSEAVVPKGYVRCSKCGDLVKDGKKCTCDNSEAVEAEDSESVGLL